MENAARNFYDDFKKIDRKVLKPLFGGRTTSFPVGGEEEALLSDVEEEGRHSQSRPGAGRYVAPAQGGYQAMHDEGVTDLQMPREVSLRSVDPEWGNAGSPDRSRT